MTRKARAEVERDDLATLNNPAKIIDNKMPAFVRIILALFAVPGVILIAVSGYRIYSQNEFIERSERVTGRVVSLNSRNHMTAPVIEYEWNGQQWLHASTTYSSPPAYAIHEAVAIYVNREDPEDILVDTFMDRWFLTTVLGSMGVFFTGIPVLAVVLNKRRKPHRIH